MKGKRLMVIAITLLCASGLSTLWHSPKVTNVPLVTYKNVNDEPPVASEEEETMTEEEAIEAFNESVASMTLLATPQDMFSKIKEALTYYSYIENKESVATSYELLTAYVATYNYLVTESTTANANTLYDTSKMIVGINLSVILAGLTLLLLKRGAVRP